MKDENIPFDACEGHEKEIDDVQRVVKPVPQRAEDVERRVDERVVHVDLGERERDGDEEKRDDEKNEDHVVVEFLSKD